MGELDELKEKIAASNRRRDEATAKLKGLVAQKSEFEAQMRETFDKLATEHASRRQDLKDELAEMRKQTAMLDEKIDEQQAEIQKLAREHSETLAKTQAQFVAALKDKDDANAKLLTDIWNQFREMVVEMNKQNNAQFKQMMEQIEKQDQSMANMMKRMDERLARMEEREANRAKANGKNEKDDDGDDDDSDDNGEYINSSSFGAKLTGAGLYRMVEARKAELANRNAVRFPNYQNTAPVYAAFFAAYQSLTGSSSFGAIN